MNKKILKASIISFSSTTIVATPIAVAYGIKLDNKKSYKKIIFNEEKIKKQSQEERIINGELIKLNSQDFLKIIKGIKNGTSIIMTLFIKEIDASIIEKIKKIDDETFKIVFDILLNRGLSDMTEDDALKLKKVFQIFLGNNNLIEYIKYFPTVIKSGLSANKALSNSLMEKIANMVVSTTKNKWFEYIKYLPTFIEGGVNMILNDQNMFNEIKQKLENSLKKVDNDNINNILQRILNKKPAGIGDLSTKKIIEVAKNLDPNLKNGLLKQDQNSTSKALWNQTKQFFPSLKDFKLEIEKIVKFINKIFKEGLKNIKPYSFVEIYKIVKKLRPSLTISLSDSQIANIVRILKNGFKSIPEGHQTLVIHGIIDQFKTKNENWTQIIKRFI